NSVASRGLEKQLSPDRVRVREDPRVEYGKAVVRLGGEVDDDVDLVLAERPRRQLEVGDVSLDERNVLGDVLPSARVGEQVGGDDVIAASALTPATDEVGADEAGRAGDEQAHRSCATRTPRRGRASADPSAWGRSAGGARAPRTAGPAAPAPRSA